MHATEETPPPSAAALLLHRAVSDHVEITAHELPAAALDNKD